MGFIRLALALTVVFGHVGARSEGLVRRCGGVAILQASPTLTAPGEVKADFNLSRAGVGQQPRCDRWHLAQGSLAA